MQVCDAMIDYPCHAHEHKQFDHQNNTRHDPVKPTNVMLRKGCGTIIVRSLVAQQKPLYTHARAHTSRMKHTHVYVREVHNMAVRGRSLTNQAGLCEAHPCRQPQIEHEFRRKRIKHRPRNLGAH
jgi:hypothetical protein